MGPLRKLGWLVFVAVVYFVAARLSVLLAIPPGYATAVWPAAGIALVCMLRLGYFVAPAVAVGSFASNIWITLASGGKSTALSIAMTGSIAVGAALQAMLGVYLLRRFVHQPLAIDRDRDVFRFLVAAGPVGCLVSATWGTTSLAAAGLLPLSSFMFNWWTWWVGDTIGTLLVAPVVLAFVGEPAQAWRPRRWSVALPLSLGFFAVTLLFVRVNAWQRERTHADFIRRADQVERNLERVTDRYVDTGTAIATFYEASKEITRKEMVAFTRPLLSRHRGVVSLALLRRDRDGSAIIARIVPPSGNAHLLGLDLAADPIYRDTFERAAVTKLPAASPPFERDDRLVFVLVVPAYREHELSGFSATTIDTRELFAEAFADLDLAALQVSITDETETDAPLSLFIHPAEHVVEKWSGRLDVAGRRWRIDAGRGDGSVAHWSWEAWAVLTGGLASVALLGGMLLLVTGRSARKAAIGRDQRFHLELNDALRACRDREEVATLVCDRLSEFLAARCVFDAITETDRREETLVRPLEWAALDAQTQAELETGITVVVTESAAVGVPLLSDGEWTASLWVIGERGRGWEPRELVLIQGVAEQMWAWLGHLRAMTELETRVGARTRDLAAALGEKDVLLREIHHRVKNNLQVISSLLNMQALSSGDPRVSEALNESRARVQSIALVHDQLYRSSRRVSSIDLKHYLDELVASIERSQRGASGANIQVSASSVTLPLDKAVPCGLVVNELLTNAIKHAFPAGRTGTITISSRAEGNEIVLRVHDDGIGLPSDFDVMASPGLGMVVVTTLAAQLHGALAIVREPGTSFELRFPLETP